MKKQTNLLFYFLSLYLLIQFVWWGYLLINGRPDSQYNSSNRIYMILGEGSVFLILLLLGFRKIKKSIDKEITLSKNQNNFLLSITHELKTPIASIKLYLQTLNKGKISAHQNESLLNNAIKENKRLEDLINNILHVSSMDSNKMNPNKSNVEIEKLLNKVSSQFLSRYKNCNIKLTSNSNYIVAADEFMLETIFNNLLDNSIKYSGEDCELNITCTSLPDTLVVSFTDNGPGIPKNEEQLIFNRFYRIENEETRRKKGSGLGLYIAKEFINLHKGNITYKRNIPNGSIFEISLPK